MGAYTFTHVCTHHTDPQLASRKAEAEKWLRLRGERDAAAEDALMWRQRCEAAERRCAELEATVARLETEANAATVAAGAAASVAAVEAAALAARTAAAAEMDVLRSQNQQGEVALAAVQGQLREATAAVKAREAELETIVAEHARREEETRKLLDQLALAGQGYEAELAARDEALAAARADAHAAKASSHEELLAVTAAVQAELVAYKAETEASMQQMQTTLQERGAALAGARDEVTEQSARIMALKAQVDKLERAAAERELLVRHQRDELDKYHARGVLPGACENGVAHIFVYGVVDMCCCFWTAAHQHWS